MYENKVEIKKIKLVIDKWGRSGDWVVDKIHQICQNDRETLINKEIKELEGMKTKFFDEVYDSAIDDVIEYLKSLK